LEDKMARIGVGVDIGHGSIKIIQIAKNKNQLELIGYAKILIPPGSINDSGLVTNQTAIIEAIIQACSLAHLKQKKVITAVAGDAVIIKYLNLPMMVGPELGEVIRFEVERILTFPIREAEYDWDILRQQDSGEMELMVVAVPNKIIASQLVCLEQAGLKTAVVDAQPFANLRSLEIEMTRAADDIGGVALLDIGLTMTQMAIYYEKSIRVTRVITTAGNSITKGIVDQLQISYEKAEAIKCNLGNADYEFIDSNIDTEIYRANEIIQQKLAEMVVEIRRSLDFFKLQFQDTPINELILTGGSSKLRNLASYLQRELGVVVEMGDPLTGLQLKTKQTDRAVLLGNPYQFSVAIGLALRGVE
jgi:type IV pilus assembly protein PilM